MDAGNLDAGTTSDGGGTIDAGAPQDAGSPDAGEAVVDAGGLDAGDDRVGSGELVGELAFPVRLAEIYRYDLGGGTPDWSRSMIVLGDHGPCTDRSPDGGNTLNPDGGRGNITFARFDTQYLFLDLNPSVQLDAGVYSANGSIVRLWYLVTDAGSSWPLYIGAVGAAGTFTSLDVGLDAVGTLDVSMNHSDGGRSTLRGTFSAHFCGFY